MGRGNNADEILPGLWIGNKVAAADDQFLREKRVRAVFNCTKDLPFSSVVKRQYRIPVDDNLQPDEIRNLELWSMEVAYKIAAEMREARANREAVLVHCHAGMQRSAASVAMYLIAAQGMQTDSAIAFIREKRPIAFQPSANFYEAIRGFERAFERDIRPKLLDAEV